MTIDIRKEYPHRPPMAFILADLAKRGFRLSNNCKEWFLATKVH